MNRADESVASSRRSTRSFFAQVRKLGLTILAVIGALGGLVSWAAASEGFPLREETFDTTYSDGYRVLVDVRAPDPTLHSPPEGGWPIVLIAHGLGASRRTVAEEARVLSRRGYVTVTYDVRGQGESMSMNDPRVYGWTAIGVRELVDMAEVIDAASARYSRFADPGLVGVHGSSQGAVHAWAAAALSGKTLPAANAWRSEPFPVISCVALRAFGPDFLRAGFPDLGTVNDRFLSLLFPPRSNLHVNPRLRSYLESRLREERYDEIVGRLRIPGLDIHRELMNCEVPIYANVAYDDFWENPTGVVDLWSRLSPGVPRRLEIKSGFHGSPANHSHSQTYGARVLLWFDRFLKDVDNGLADDPPIYCAVTPEDESRYVDVQSIWDARTLRSLAEIGVGEPAPTPLGSEDTSTKTRLYLQGRLLGSEPPSLSSRGVIVHRNPVALTMETFLLERPTTDVLLSLLPLSSIDLTSEALEEDRHLFGRSRVTLHLATSQRRFQVHAALYDVDEKGANRFICDGQITIRDARRLGTYSFSTYFQSYVVRAGHRIRLRLENLAIYAPPVGSGAIVRYAPLFDEYEVSVLYGPDHPSVVDLPLLPIDKVSMTASREIFLDGADEVVEFALYDQSLLEDGRYVLLGSVSGTEPGTNIGDLSFPLNFDCVTGTILDRSCPSFLGFLGSLDQFGRGSARLNPEFFYGKGASALRIDLCAVVSRSTNEIVVSDPLSIRVLP